MSRRKKLLFSALAVILVLAVVELVLWAAGVETLRSERDPFRGFSESVRVFREVPEREVYATPPQAVRHSFNYQEFRAEKPPGGLRLFTLGGSSAYGFPWGARAAFTRMLGEALAAAYPDRTVEAINAAAMSYGSHRLRLLAGEVARHEPDIVVVYGGHNEFVETRFYRELLERRPALDPLRGLLHRWRLYASMTRLVEGLAPAADESSNATVGELLGLDVEREDNVQRGAEEKAAVRGLFQQNLDAILDTFEEVGARVVLCTVPSNLRDWRPNQSFFEADVPAGDREEVQAILARTARAWESDGPLGDAEREALLRARELAPGYAAVHYELGRLDEELGRWDEARDSYQRARDTDGQPARALGSLNDTIREVARRRGAVLVDMERLFERRSRRGLVGFDLLEDYVHPNREGHRLIALELFRVVLEQGLAGPPRAAEESLFLSAVGRVADSLEPSAAPGDEPQTAAALFNLAIVLENQGRPVEAIEKYRACLDLDPRYYAARCNLGQIHLDAGRPGIAEREFRAALGVEPRHLKSLVGLGTALAALGRAPDAEAAYRRAVDVDARSAPAWNGLGLALAQQRRMAEAESAFRRSVELDPDDADALGNLGQALSFLDRGEEAISWFRRALAVRHDHRRARNGLADALAARGELDEAARLYRESLAADPGDARALQGLARIEGRRR